MLEVTLYTVNKRENSTKRPDDTVVQRTHDAVLKENTSLLTPEILFDFGLSGNPSFYNYAYISDFGNRYYFIRDWTAEAGHLWRATMEVDVLATWKEYIGNSTQYVLRSSFTRDENIIDMLYPAKMPCTLTTVEMEDFPTASSITSGTYVVGIINKSQDAIGAVAYYVFNEVQFRNFMKYMLGDTSWIGSVSDISDDLLKVLMNPMQYISSVIWYPTNAPKGEAVQSVDFGWWNIGVSCSKLKTTGVLPEAYSVEIPKHPLASSRGKYLNLSPFSTYDFDSRIWGVIPLDTSALYNTTTLFMEVRTDFVTGNSTMRLQTSDSGYTLAVRTGQFGVPIQIAQIGVDYVNGTLSTVSNIAGSVGSAAKSAMSADGVGFATGMISGVASGIQSAINSFLPQTSTTGSNGSIANFMNRPAIYAKFAPPVNEDNADLGRPLCQSKQLKTIPGYQLVLHADITLPGTSVENRNIKNYLESGYFFE